MTRNRPSNINSFDSDQQRVIEHIFDLLNNQSPKTLSEQGETTIISSGGGVNDWSDFTAAVNESSGLIEFLKKLRITTIELSSSLLLLDPDGDGTLAWDFSAARTITFPDATDTLVGKATTDTLTNKTIDGDNNTVSNLAHGAEVDNPSSGVHGVTGDVVGTTDDQDLTTKAILLKPGTASLAPLKFQDGTLLSTPETGATEFNNNRLYVTEVDRRRAVSTAEDVITSTATVANTTTETTVYTAAVAADELKTGKMYKVTMLGRYSTANASDTFDLDLKIGGTVVSTTTSTAASVTDAGIFVSFFMTVRSTGATGSVMAYTSGKFDGVDQDSPGTGAVTVDTTVAEDVTATIQWSAADPGNTVSIEQAVTEVMN